MTTYEILRVVGIFVGPLVLGLFGWIIWATRKLMMIEECKNLYQHNIPELFDRVNALEKRTREMEVGK